VLATATGRVMLMKEINTKLKIVSTKKIFRFKMILEGVLKLKIYLCMFVILKKMR
jgi:hypothetical protein